ncbi:MAG: XRE family transcriptional regulator [Treponema sp.]|jgi:transcriptional regulator with XRE-family HTH domain|nr:XRE family transcriptional regulator [Treponema sp.]
MELNDIIAANLNRLRTGRHLSLGQLAELSGISKVMLSQIEKGDANPSINTIWKIARGLKVPYTKLLDEPARNAVLVKKTDGREQENEENTCRIFCYFTSTPTRNFELFRMELDPHSSNDSVGHSEKSEEYVYVTDGELVLQTDGTSYTLQEGDAISFDSSKPHTYSNLQDRPLTCIVINYYP